MRDPIIRRRGWLLWCTIWYLLLLLLLLNLLNLLILKLILIMIMLKLNLSRRRWYIFKSIYSRTSIYIFSYLRVSLLNDRTFASILIILCIHISVKILLCLVFYIVIMYILIIMIIRWSTLIICGSWSLIINGWYLCHHLLVITISITWTIYINDRNIIVSKSWSNTCFIHWTR